ncbi:disease resistance protein RGA5 [Triticum aestivum]|nr:disease resistance protein RGA5-like [Triticum aestivum]
MVSASTGVMNSLMVKLANLKEEKKVRKETNSLKGELSTMEALLFKVATRDDPDVQAKEWTRQQAPQAVPEVAGQEIVRKDARVRGGNHRAHDRFKDANERHKRYKLENLGTNDTLEADEHGPNSAIIPTQLIYEEEPRLVAIDGRTMEVVDHLMGDKEQQLRVVSIHGFGGLGKTTLANEVYHELRGRFECHAFVYAGRNQHIRTTLLEMLSQVSDGQPAGLESMEEQQVIKQLRESLEKKRYLIVIDDICMPSVWKVIKCALRDGMHGSKIITTTRIHDVAKLCCNRPTDTIYPMGQLGEVDSKKLLSSRIFDLERKPPSDSDGFLNDISKICDGVPLAIAVMAGLLSRKFLELADWKKVEEYVMSGLKQYSMLQGIRKILYLSYSDLALPLKTCLLYLSIFPKYYEIKKGRLIWRWSAEGFIPAGEASAWKRGESYFNALINTRLIQPVFGHNDDQPVGCTVHGVILEFIASLSSKENFVTTDAELVLAAPRDAIRRLSLSSNQDDDILKSEADSMNLYQVRSLTLFRIAKWMEPHLIDFQLLRVLDLEDVEGLKDEHLAAGLGRLFLLKYLGLGGEGVTVLPKDVDELQHMETLDVRRTSVKNLSAANKLPKLASLLATDANVLPAEVDKMHELQEFSMVSIGDQNSLECLAKLAKLKRLRTLGVKWCFADDNGSTEAQRKSFVTSLGELGLSSSSGIPTFESLFLDAAGGTSSLDFLVKSWVPPRALQKFMMTSPNCYLSGVPANMALDTSSSITHLEIAIAQLGDEGLKVLGELPLLVFLKLRCLLTTENSLTITADKFRSLQVFSFECQDGGLGFVFGEGAMAQLRKLRLYFKAGEESRLQGVGHLSVSYLCQVHTTVYCAGVEILPSRMQRKPSQNCYPTTPRNPPWKSPSIRNHRTEG